MVVGREPIGEIEHEAREEPGLGDTEQEADDAEAGRPGNQSGQTARMPQVIMMRAIHSRAPTFSMITLLGTSKMK